MATMGVSSTDRLLTPAITVTLNELNLTDVDSGVAQLAIRLAQQVDEAAWAERAADKVLARIVGGDDELDDMGDDERGALKDEVAALRSKLAARTAISDLGPKLLAVLDAVGATPMARAKIAKMVPVTGAAVVAGSARLAALRGGLGA